MKKLTLIVIFFIFLIISEIYAGLENKKTVYLNNQSGTKILANTAIIRFRQEQCSQLIIDKSMKNEHFNIISPLLTPAMSISKNPELKKKLSPELLSKQEAIINSEEPLLRTYIIEYDGNINPIDFCRKLKEKDRNIEIAEPYYVNKLLSTPNDPFVVEQTILTTINAFQAWDINQGSSNVIIGISDNGIYQDHEDLGGSIAINSGEIPNNGIDDDGDGLIDDYRGYNMAWQVDGGNKDNTSNSSPEASHGTNVAGIAGATTNNGKGVAGIGYKCKIFPFKAAVYGSDDIIYGYQSIIAAAMRGCKVLNCSWGSHKTYSDIDQSVINYALAHNLLVVAAGGNYEIQTIETWFPAGYYGVLGVGEVDQNDVLTSTSSLGNHISVMAPGLGNWTTSISGNYEQVSEGTSFASPAAAGFAAMIRATFPSLDAIQTLQYARISVDDISAKNPDWKGIIPGRIDMYKALSHNPNTTPGIRLMSAQFSKPDGTITNRFTVFDSVLIKINLHNYLANANNLRFVLSDGYDLQSSVIILDSVLNISSVASGTDASVGYFRLLIQYYNLEQVQLRLDIYGENNYHDFYLIPFTPSSEITTFANNEIEFSVSDRGCIGFGGTITNPDGVGFIYKDKGNQIYNGGIMACIDGAKYLSANSSQNGTNNDFLNTKPFMIPNGNIGIFNDGRALLSDRFGLEVTERFEFLSSDIPFTKVYVKLKNISDSSFFNLAAGFYLDWDIGSNTDSNIVWLFPAAIPSSVTGAAAEVAQGVDSPYPIFGAAVYSPENNVEAEAAGLNYTITGNFLATDQIRALNSGVSWQNSGWNDISMVTGIKFLGETKPGAEHWFTALIGCSDSLTQFADIVKQNLTIFGVSNNKPFPNNLTIQIKPQPVSDFCVIDLTLPTSGKLTLQLFNSMGTSIKTIFSSFSNSGNIEIPCEFNSLPPGLYFIRANINGYTCLVKVIVVK